MTLNIRGVINIRYAQIREMDISNGESIGIALFVQGCHFHCKNCFNIETWDFDGGKEWTPEVEDKFVELANRSYVKRISILGGEPLADENLDGVLHLVERLRKEFPESQYIVPNQENDHNILNENPDKRRLSLPQKMIWLYTGYTVKLSEFYVINDNYDPTYQYRFIASPKSCHGRENIIRSDIINSVDILVDGQYVDSQRDIALQWRGSKNQRVIDVQNSLKKGEITLWTHLQN